jgi:hypothetical protein
MTQKQHVLQLIKDAGLLGIGSNELRNYTHAVDVPKCVSDLRKEGHTILSQDLSDGTVKYFYDGIQGTEITVPSPKKLIRYDYEYYTNDQGYDIARKVPVYE